MQEEFNEEDFIAEENYKQIRQMFEKHTFTGFIGLRDAFNITNDINSWTNSRHSYSVLFVTLKEVLWYAEEVEDYEFCAVLAPMVDECSKYCDKMAEELEHFYI